MSASISSKQKAVKSFGRNDARLVADAPVPECPADYILVKVEAVALNPTDYKHIDNFGQPDYHHTIGCDYAGTVVSIGSEVTKKLTVGERVAGYAHGQKHEDPDAGVFAEYAKVKGDIQVRTITDLPRRGT